MTTIVRNSSHGNAIRVIFFPEKGLYRKVTFNPRGQALLKSEASGISWYYSRNNYDDSKVRFHCHKKYARLDFPCLRGFKVDYGLPFSKNFLFFELALSHYISTWPVSREVPCHGDLTLDNILIHSDSAVFIDWEHFQGTGECWGFDLCYLCLSMICLPFLQGRRINPEDWALFTKYWRKLRDLGVNDDVIQNPIHYFRVALESNSTWIDIVKASPNKMYPLIIDSAFCDLLQKKLDCKVGISC